MAKMMKRMMALVLALALCASQLALPVLAETNPAEPAAPSVHTETVTNPDGSVTVTVTQITPGEQSEVIHEVTTTTGDNFQSVTDTTTKMEDTDDAFITEIDSSTVTTENIPEEGDTVVLNPDPIPEEMEPVVEQLPETEELTEGQWEDKGEATEELNKDGLATPEEMGELVQNGEATTENVDVEHQLKAEDATDDVTLDFTAPEAGKVTEATGQVEIEVDMETKESSELTDSTTTEGQIVEGETTLGTADAGTLVADPALDAEVAAGEQFQVSEDGRTTTTTNTTKTGDENPIYTRTTVTSSYTDDYGQPVDLTEDEKAALASSTRGVTSYTYQYLTKNEQPSVTNDDGSQVNYSYQYTYDAEGNITSITETIEALDAKGNPLSKSSETFHYTTIATTPITVVDPHSKITYTCIETTQVKTEVITNTQFSRTNTTDISRTDTTTNTYDVTQESFTTIEGNSLITGTDGKTYVVYEGKMYAVVDNGGDPTSNFNVAGTTLDGWGHGTANDEWEHIGENLKGESVKKNNGGETTTYMFNIKDGNQIRYVYCIELDQQTNHADYSVSYFQDDAPDADKDAYWGDSIRQLRSVAVNGFWNTESGIGSLDSVKSLLRRYQEQLNLTDNDINGLTKQDALTATQVALWKYGAKDTNVFGDNFSNDKTIVKLRNLLVELAEEDAKNNVDPETGEYLGAVQEIDETAISGASLTLKNQVVDNSGNAVTNDAGKALYNTDLVVKMDISESSINGNLLVTVTDANGNKLGTYRLAEDGTSNVITNAAAGVADKVTGTKQVKANGDGTYTLEDLVLPDGTKFTVNLTGTQHLDDGITIYMNSRHQDFIGLVSKDKNVNLSFDMEFTVTDPQLEKTTTSYTQQSTSTQDYSGSRSQEQVKTDVLVKTTGTLTTEGYTTTTFLGDANIINEKVSETKYNYYSEVYPDVTEETIPEEEEEIDPPGGGDDEEVGPPDDGGDPVPHNDDFGIPEQANFIWDDGMDDDLVILDEEVPLADAPKTGDISTLWAAISLFSLGGSSLLGRKRKEENAE